MTLNLRRIVAAAIPIAVLASTSLASDAQQFGRIYHPFAVRPYATGATTLGGGATLPIPGYLGLTESSGSTNFGKAGSLFGYFATVSGGLNVEYCATGSGKGRGVFEGVAGTVNTPCSNAVSGTTATTFGFLPPSGSPKQNFPTLAGTDAPVASQTEYNTYSTNHATGEPVELPSIFGAVAIYYHLNGVTARENIPTATLCGVYDGRITTYGKLLSLSASDPNYNTAITPVYRSDGSGTTFNFSNHLATVCSSSDPSAYNGNQTSTGTTATTEAFPKLPRRALGASGNGGVIAAVNGTAPGETSTSSNGYLGYAEAGYLTGSLVTGTNYALIDGKNPIANLPEAANSVAASALVSNVVVVQGAGPATTATLTPRTAGTRCVEVVTPSAYAKPSTGYSIIAVTYLLINSTGNGSTGASSLKSLETIINTPGDFKNPSTKAPITTIDEAEPTTKAGAGTTGYSSLGSAFNATLKGAASSCIGA